MIAAVALLGGPKSGLPGGPRQVTVCTSPGSACTSRYLAGMQTRPVRIFVTVDGGDVVGDLTWSGWGQPTARGSGTLEIDTCNPDCARGSYRLYPAAVTLTGLTPYGSGDEAYANMTITAPHTQKPVQKFTRGLVP